jgi:isohexenylglutaconyl-CoA hydratase
VAPAGRPPGHTVEFFPVGQETGNVTQYENIKVERDGDCVTLTLNRPERRNALTHAMMVEIGAAVAAIRGNGEVRIVILRGAGGFFSAGGDFDFMRDMPPAPAPGEIDPLYPGYRMFGEVLEELNRLPQAVVAMVEGPAAGGGFGMVCCADVAIVRADAKFGMPEPRAGFIPSQIIPLVVRRIGEGRARRLAVMGITVDGQEAVDMGIAHYCCADNEAMEVRLAAVLGEIRRCEPAALAAVKRLLLDCALKGDQAVLDDAAETLVGLLRRPSALVGIDAFMAKKLPPWAARGGDDE